MGTRKQTKADVILKGARGRVKAAQEIVDRAKWQMEIATASWMAHASALEQLEKDLAPTPRKVSSPKPSAPAVTRRSSRKDAKDQSTASSGDGSENVLDASKVRERCVICGGSEAYSEHQPGARDYHIFRTKLKTKNSKDNGESKLLDNPEVLQHGATA